MTVTQPDPERIREVAEGLVSEDGPSIERIEHALRRATGLALGRLDPCTVERGGVEDLLAALVSIGPGILEDTAPQALEDALLRLTPDSVLDERTLRLCWLALCDELGRTGDRPQSGAQDGLESWVAAAAARPWPYYDGSGLLDQVSALSGSGQQVVVVRGPGRTSFLAALRRRFLSDSRQMYVPPVTSAARDGLRHLLPTKASGIELPQPLDEAADKITYSEDHIGLLGRLGKTVPVALLLDDAQVQCRSILFGLAVFLEPDPNRDALLVCAVDGDPRSDGPLSEVVADAAERGILTELELPCLDTDFAHYLLEQAAGVEATPEIARLLADACPSHGSEAMRIGAAQAWARDCSGLSAVEIAHHLRQPLDGSRWAPRHPVASALLSVAAVEGSRFHGFTVGEVIGRSEEEVEDLLQDEEFEIDGTAVGGCCRAVPMGKVAWIDVSDGAHPVYEFDDVRYVLSLTENMDPERRSTVAQALFGQLWAFHGVAGAWQSISTMWRLAALSGRHGVLQQNVLGPAEPARIEMSFRRLLPVLQYEKVYRLGTARLVGAAMEFGGLAIAMGNANDADQAFQAAAAAAQRLSRLGAAGEAMARLGELRLALALPSPARAAFDVAAQLIEKGGSQGSLNRLGLLKAEVFVLEGQVAEACESLSKAVDGLIQQEDFGHAALGYMRWGRLRYELGLYDEAVDALDKAIHFADESGDGRSVGASRLARAFLMAEKGDLTSAFELLNQAAQAFQQLGLPIGIIEVAAADLQRRGGSPAEAEERFKVAADMFKQANAAIQWADAYHGLGRCRLDQGKFADATKVFDDIEPLRTRARDRFGLVRLFLDQGRARLGTADPVGAFRYACMARELADSAGLGLHLEVASGLVLELAPALDGVSDTTAEAVGREAVSAVRAMEATWNAPPQPKDSSSELH